MSGSGTLVGSGDRRAGEVVTEIGPDAPSAYFRHRPKRILIYVAIFVAAVGVYVGALLLASVEFGSPSGMLCAAGIFFMFPWFGWLLVAMETTLFTPRCARIRTRVSVDGVRMYTSRWRSALLWSGMGVAGLAFVVGMLIGAGPSGGDFAGRWRYTAPVAGVGMLLAYPPLAFASVEVTLQDRRVRQVTRIGLGRRVLWTRTTEATDVEVLRIDSNSVGSIEGAGSVVCTTALAWRGERVRSPHPVVHLPTAVFNDPAAPTVAEVVEATGVRIEFR